MSAFHANRMEGTHRFLIDGQYQAFQFRDIPFLANGTKVTLVHKRKITTCW